MSKRLSLTAELARWLRRTVGRAKRFAFGSRVTIAADARKLTVRATISDKVLKGKVDDSRPGKKKYFFHLLHDGAVIDCQGWRRNGAYEWRLDSPGSYVVRGFSNIAGNKIATYSNKVVLLPDGIDREWAELASSPANLDDLPFASYVEPHQDFLISNIASWQSLALPGFNRVKEPVAPEGVAVFHKAPVADSAQVVFSGTAFFNDRLIFGQSEAEITPTDQILHCPGDFSAIFLRADTALISTDYFGIQKVYYYANGDQIVASNRLHLLVLALVAAGVELEMDGRTVISTLAGGHTQPYQQSLSAKTAVNGVRLLSIDQEVSVSSHGYIVQYKPIREVLLSQDFALSDRNLMEGVSEGAAEIRVHAQAVINHHKFESILVDASGGMDTRVIVSAASSFAAERDRIFVNACDTGSIPLDIRVACTMAEHFGLKFDDLSETVRFVSRKKRQQAALSSLLGVYFAHNIEAMRGEERSRDMTINVTGFFGEICLRPYYSRSHIERPELHKLDIDGFISFLRGNNHVVIGGEDEQTILFEELRDAIDAIPGRNSLEKLDLHYLCYRNGLHCSDVFRWSYQTPRVGIIQSDTSKYLAKSGH